MMFIINYCNNIFISSHDGIVSASEIKVGLGAMMPLEDFPIPK